MRAPLQDRFWSKVEKTDRCWLWRGALNTGGYGVIRDPRKHHALVLAHRLSLELHSGQLVSGVVLHSCNNPQCVNPAHLRASSQAENMRQAVAEGRLRGGRRMTADHVRTIKRLLSEGVSQHGVARMTGHCIDTVSQIATGKRHAEVA